MGFIDDRRYKKGDDGKPVPTGWAGKKPYRARYRAPDGRERSKSFALKRDAERWLRSVVTEVDKGAWIDPANGRITFADWVERYFADAHKRPTTEARDRAVVRRWLNPAFGKVKMTSITPTMVRGLRREMEQTLKPDSVRTCFGVLRAIMNAAVEAGIIGRSPCQGVRLPRHRYTKPRFLSMEELHRLAAVMPEQYRPMVYVGGVLGLRFSEVAGLRVRNIDFLRRTVEVAQTVAEVEGVVMIADTKNKTSARTIPAPSFVLDMLAAHLARRGRPGPDEQVFVAPEGGLLRAAGFRHRVWAPAVTAAGLDGLTFHGLRHTAVGLMIELGVHPKVIQQRMGHESIRTTFDVYGSVLPSTDEAVADALDAMLRDEGDDDGLAGVPVVPA